MHRTINTAADFVASWDNRVNFMLEPTMLPFEYAFPSTERIVHALLANANSIGITGTMPDKLEVENVIDSFRGMSLADLMRTRFQLTHFALEEFDHSGNVLHGFHDAVLTPWRAWLRDLGFSWDRCYPVLRVSGPNTVTGYHMDRSNVLFWNVRGRKFFHGFRDSYKYAPLDFVVENNNHAPRPDDVDDADVLTYEVGDNGFLWNHLLTPHWVDAPDLSVGINLSHGGLRLNGTLCPNEHALYERLGRNPNASWKAETASSAD